MNRRLLAGCVVAEFLKEESMIAFHGDEKIKAKYLARVRAHIKADELIHGVYWENGKGCAVGCTVHSGSHAAYETELGIPRILAKLEDGIFESLEKGRAKRWPNQFLSSIEPGADLSLVWPKFAVWMLVDPKWGVLQFAKSKKSKKAIQEVAAAYQGVCNGSTESANWKALRAAADADAYAAVAAYAAAAADAYAYAAAAADAYAYAAADAKKKWRNAQARKLLELLASAPIAKAA